jgi:V/A-type H+-transporting ATPase subunit I
MLVEMSRVFVVGLKKDLKPVLDTVADYGKVHLGDMTSDLLGDDVALAELEVPLVHAVSDEQFAEIGRRADSVILGLRDQLGGLVPDSEVMGGDNPYAAMPREDFVKFAQVFIDDIEPQAKELALKMEDISRQATELERFSPVLEKISPLVDEMITPGTVDSIALLFEEKYASILPKFGETLRDVSQGHAQTVSKRIPGDDSLLVMVLIDDDAWSRRVRTYLTDEGVNRVSLPGNLRDLPFLDAVAEAAARHTAMAGIQDAAKAQIETFYTDNIRKLNWINELVRGESNGDEETLEVKYGESAFTFVIEGYLPAVNLKEFEDVMVQEWGDAIRVDVVPIEPNDYPRVPVQLENTGKSKYFESALGIWGRPMYGTLDPSGILRWTFPLVFGLIVGDFGYGLLLFAITSWAEWKFKDSYGVRAFANVLKPAGIATMIFGVIYWEMFGDLAHVYIPLLNQVHPYMFFEGFGLPFMRALPQFQTTYLFIAIGFGFIQVCFGLILGMINSKKLGQSRHVWEKAGIMTVLIAAVLFAVINFIPALTAGLSPAVAAVVSYIIYIALAVGAVSLLFGGGIMGAIETLEAVSNIASYIRIMAVGLVGALLADAANKLAFVIMPGAGGIAIALLLHVVNFAIICFSPSIHALRLNFLEFFGKFWKPGAVSYTPFARKEGQS